MKVYVLYHPESEYARPVEEFVREYKRRGESKLEIVSLETRDGAATASLYDVLQYPAVLVIREDGQLLKAWQGKQLPLISEVAAYARG